MNNVMLLCHHG